MSRRSVRLLPCLLITALAAAQTAKAPKKEFAKDAASAPLPLIAVTPCRIVDTRLGPAPFGAPSLNAGETRTIPIPQSNCSIPNTAQAYSLNFTVIPAATLAFLSVWPAGQAQPLVSTLNSFEGAIIANAAIVPAGANGGINIFATNRTDVVIDVNGYFDPTAAAASSLPFYTLTPCRIVDTRPGQNTTGAFGPPSMAGQTSRSFPVPTSSCNVPATARAYSLNITVVPKGPLAFLTAWPTGLPQPVVSTLNSFQGLITANAAIVPAGANGAISIFVTDATDLVIDINGYFAP